MELSIITISTNELHYLKKMIPLLFKFHPEMKFELIVIDNASSDGTFEWIGDHFPRVKVIRNRKKQGFAFNNNAGIKRSRGRYVLLLNPDIIFVESVFEQMIEFMDNNPEVGLSSCKLINVDGSLQNSVRRFYTYFTLLVRRFPLYRKFFQSSRVNLKHLYRDRPPNEVIYPDWVLGAFLLIPRRVLNEVGFLDERFRLYFEDVDYCRRIWSAGYLVAYYPFKRLIHLYNRESDVKKLFQNFRLKKGAKIHLDSMMKVLRKYNYRLGLNQQEKGHLGVEKKEQ